jgi:C1A family cysteine protease
MKKTVIFVCVFVFVMGLSLANAQDRELQGLQEILKARNASWTAGENTLTRMAIAERQKLLGLLPGVYNPAQMPALTVISDPVRADRYEAPHTGIRDQASCGSCYAHGAIASYESWKLVTAGQTYDLSEQWFMMKAKDIGPYGGCDGWYLDTSMNLLKDYGVANEKDCPYLGYEAACSSGSPVHKISSWASTTDKATIQTALQKYGLVYVGFAVYNDFFNYSGGYYAYATGGLAGYHAVAIVGFDDQGFKVKNSWGTGWGENGYFRILYSQMTNSVQFGTCFGGSFYITN